ncbi:MAG: fibronectin type III domain-containing protein [Byssovorax sp.]
MATSRRKRALLALKRNNFPDLLSRAKGIYNGLMGHPGLFASPSPPLAVLEARIDAFDAAQQIAVNRAKGAAALRNVKADELITSLEVARAYVQQIADENAEQAVAIIEAAGMVVFEPGGYDKPILKALQNKPAGPVALLANVGALTAESTGKVFFNWQSSADGGQTWSDLPPTPLGHTQVAGLPPLSVYGFRVSVTDAEGQGPFSQMVTFLVH